MLGITRINYVGLNFCGHALSGVLGFRLVGGVGIAGGVGKVKQ